MTDYEQVYSQQDEACGQPFPEFVRFFEELDGKHTVLDLGCGQGRDALMAARRGHTVVGLDVSPTGVAQMREQAAAEGLSIDGRVGDLTDFESDEDFDVAVLDRLLHMLPDDATRRGVLTRTCACIRPGGHILIADTPKHLPMIKAFFLEQGEGWSCTLARKGFLFWRRSGDNPDGPPVRPRTD